MPVTKTTVDPVVDRYISDFQARHREFLRDRQAELRQLGLDAITRIYNEYFALPTKPAFEVLLQAILDPAERDRLQVDAQFTQAWQIFVDLCWLHKRATRAGIISGAALFSLVAIAVVMVNSAQLGGVTVLGILALFIGVWSLPAWLGGRRH